MCILTIVLLEGTGIDPLNSTFILLQKGVIPRLTVSH